MCVFLLGGVFLLWYELCHVAIFYHTDWSWTYVCHYFLSVFFAINIYGNWLMLIFTNTTGKDVIFPSGPPPTGWRYCEKCFSNAPTRSHHCPACNVCILRRDHHCWFAGTCVGYSNHRYFFVLCVHMVAASLYCNIYNWSFVHHVKGHVTIVHLVSYLIPHVTFLFGYETPYTFFVTAISMLGFLLAVLFFCLLCVQIMQLFNGQTMYERKKGVFYYNQGFKANLRDIVGYRMFLTVLCPLVPSRLPGDGIHFTSQSHKAL